MKASLSRTLSSLSQPGVVRLRPDDEEEVAQVCAAIWAESTLWNWVLGPHLNAEDPLRLEILKCVARNVFLEGLQTGGFALGYRSGGTLKAVCITSRGKAGYGWAGQKMHAAVGRIKSVWETPCWKTPAGAVGKGIDKRLQSLWRFRDVPEVKRAVGEHINISCLVCETKEKGRWYKAKLLEAVSVVADSLELPCYMVLSNSSDLDYYRAFCFSEYGPFEVGPTTGTYGDDETEPLKDVFALIRPATRL